MALFFPVNCRQVIFSADTSCGVFFLAAIVDKWFSSPTRQMAWFFSPQIVDEELSTPTPQVACFFLRILSTEYFSRLTYRGGIFLYDLLLRMDFLRSYVKWRDFFHILHGDFLHSHFLNSTLYFNMYTNNYIRWIKTKMRFVIVFKLQYKPF